MKLNLLYIYILHDFILMDFSSPAIPVMTFRNYIAGKKIDSFEYTLKKFDEQLYGLVAINEAC